MEIDGNRDTQKEMEEKRNVKNEYEQQESPKAGKIFDEVYERGTFHKMFNTGSVQKLIEETWEYLKERKFMNDVIDVIVVAATNALKIN